MLSHKELFEIEGVMILGTALLPLATLLELPPSTLFPLASYAPTLCPSPLTMDCSAVLLLTKLFWVLFGLALIVLSGMGHMHTCIYIEPLFIHDINFKATSMWGPRVTDSTQLTF